MMCDKLECSPPEGLLEVHCGTCHHTFSRFRSYDLHRVFNRCHKEQMMTNRLGRWQYEKEQDS